jgi:transposase
MDVIVERCAGLDVHKKSITACVRTPGPGRTRRSQVRTYQTFSDDLWALAEWARAEGVTQVAMEATGIYWKPVWWVLEEAGFDLLLVNPAHVKRVPGRKTDVKDAEWLAELLEHGLLRGSFVPPKPIRELRDVTRYRTRVVQERARETLRVHKVLEDAGIKLSSVATDALGVSGRAMIEALVSGVRDPEVLAQMAKARMRRKIPELRRALVGRFNEHHAAMLGELLGRLDALDATIANLDARVDVLMTPYADQRDRLDTIPAVGKRAAEVIIAEIGVDMTVFPTSAHLASWAGMCPGNKESGGKRLSGRTRKADPWLRGMLAECGWAARRTRGTYLAAQFWQIAGRRGREKACLAVGHSILVIAWHLLSTPGETYRELGPDWFARHRRSPESEQRRLIRRLEALGLKVTVEPTAA